VKKAEWQVVKRSHFKERKTIRANKEFAIAALAA